MLDDRKRFRDVMDELDKFIEDMVQNAEKMIRNAMESGDTKGPNQPLIYGFTMRLGTTDEPIIRTFGDRESEEGGWREPVIDQFINKSRGELKLFVELPGVEKEDIRLDSTEDRVALLSTHGERKYRAEIDLKSTVDPNALAFFRNGVLEITFKLKDKANKEFRRIKIE